MSNYELDKDFLEALQSSHQREVFAKITSLTFEEEPVEEIQGKITSGSVNIDGDSSVRRTCSITLVSNDLNISDYYWGLNTKIKVEVGLKNTINADYPDIIWFKQGIFLISSFSTSLNSNSYTVSVQGKDKMSLLNGDIGGSLPASVKFSPMKIWNDLTQSYYEEDVPIRDIIREAVHHYGKEMWHNIIVNDLDDAAVKLMQYTPDSASDYLYFVIDNSNEANQVILLTRDGTTTCVLESGEDVAFQNSDLITYDSLIDLEDKVQKEPTQIYLEKNSKLSGPYTLVRVEDGQNVGYEEIDLIYGAEETLTVASGDKITTMLDKIISQLNDYEYFYDVDGRFVFQKKRIYLNTSWNNIVNGYERAYLSQEEIDSKDVETYVESAALSSSHVYSFEGSNLVSAYSNQPNLNNLKNDFSIWGAKNNKNKTPIHLRYAINEKPIYYKRFDYSDSGEKMQEYVYINDEYDISDLDFTFKSSVEPTYCNWREIIYQMAYDYYQNYHNKNFEFTTELRKNSLIQREDGNGIYNDYLYPNGTTGYEMFYEDIQGFWRLLYNPNPDFCLYTEPSSSSTYYTWDGDTETYTSYNASEVRRAKTIDEVYDNLYVLNADYEYILKYDINNHDNTVDNCFSKQDGVYYLNTVEQYYKKNNDGEYEEYLSYEWNSPFNSFKMYSDIYNFSGESVYYGNTINLNTGWTLSLNNPEELLFWFDLLDDGEIQKFSISSVGDRAKVETNDKIHSIYYRDVPQIIFVEKEED